MVLDESALPASGAMSRSRAGRVTLAEAAIPLDPLFVHTLRELEGARLQAAPIAAAPGIGPAALAFRSRDFPPAPGESVGSFLARLAETPSAVVDSDLRVIRFEESSSRERPEITRRLPRGRSRILDVGCGGGRGIAGARGENPGWNVTGIEREPALARRAREVCDRVLEGDLAPWMLRLAADGERFDALVYADVLEHLEDPISALQKGRALAADGAMLVVSVPNVGHLSVVRDLVLGRFDPVPAGLFDAGHVRWFTRSWLAEALAEAGWRVETIEGERGAAPPDAEDFRKFAKGWTGADPESLETYQWVAVCRAE